MLEKIKDFPDFCVALSRHWGPLATGVAAMAVQAMVDAWWTNQAPWWIWVSIIMASLLVSSFLAWREEKQAKQIALADLKEWRDPSVALKLHKINDDIDHKQTLFLEVLGIGHFSSPDIYAVSVVALGDGKHTLSCSPGDPPSLHVSQDETKNLPVAVYDVRETVPLRVELPCKKITSNEYPVGSYFRMKVRAFYGGGDAEIEFDFGVERGALWASAPDSQDRMYSDIKSITRKPRP